MKLRRVRALVGIAALAVLVAMAWMLLGIERPEPVELKPKDPGDVALPTSPTQETGCIEPFDMDWPGNKFRRVEAAEACQQDDGSSLLEDVTITVAREGREDLLVSARTGRLPPTASTEPISLRGNVVARSTDGEVRSEELFLDEQLSRVRSSQPVTFTFGDMSGEAGAMDHDWSRDETELRDSPVVRLAGERTRGREVVVSGNLVRLVDSPAEGQPRRVEVRGAGRIDHADGHVVGESIDVELAEVDDTVRRIEAIGDAETLTRADGAGPVARRLVAERVIHGFDEEGELASVEGIGAARMTGETRTGVIRETLDADRIALALEDERPLTLDGTGSRVEPARLVIDGDAGARLLRADRIASTFDAAGEIETLSASGSAVLEQGEAAALRRLSAERLDIAFAGSGGQLAPERVAFSGTGTQPALIEEHATSEAGPTLRTISARQGELFMERGGGVRDGTLSGSVVLVGPAGTALGREARIEQDVVTLTGQASVETDGRIAHGDEVIRDRTTGLLRVRGNQHTVVRKPGGSILRDGGRRDEGADGASGTAGAGGEAGDGAASRESEPVYISSDELVLDPEHRTATYEGGRPTLRQGDDEVRSDVLVLDDARGRLIAEGEVETQLRLAPAGTGSRDPDSLFDPSRLVHGRSDSFRWNREERMVRYEGEVSLEQEASALSAETVTIRLGEDGDAEETRAVGSAFLSSPSGEAEGVEIVHSTETGVVRVIGGRRPARAKDVEGGFQTGQVLEMTLGRRGIRVISTPGRRARGSHPIDAEAGDDSGL